MAEHDETAAPAGDQTTTDPEAVPVASPPASVVEVHPAVPAKLRGGQQVDGGLLDDAVAHINAVYTRKGMETVIAVGEYVLATFFDGKADNFRQHGKTHVSFGELGNRDDLLMSPIWLWRAVSIVDQLRALPKGADTRLPYTHHTLLLPVHDEETKKDLAKKALEKGWSKRRLEEEVAKVREQEKGDSKAGRPPLPTFVKTVHKLEKLDDDDLWADLDVLDQVDAEKAKGLLKTVQRMAKRCKELEALLNDALKGEGS